MRNQNSGLRTLLIKNWGKGLTIRFLLESNKCDFALFHSNLNYIQSNRNIFNQVVMRGLMKFNATHHLEEGILLLVLETITRTLKQHKWHDDQIPG